jgi:hypothetical protein
VTPVRFRDIKADRGNLGPVMEDMWILIAMIVHPCVAFSPSCLDQMTVVL